MRPRKKPVAGDVKLDTVWCGPYAVVKCTGKHSYDIRVWGVARSYPVDRIYPPYQGGSAVQKDWSRIRG